MGFKIVNIAHINTGTLSVCSYPGKHGDVLADIETIKANNIDIVLCLLEWAELYSLNVLDYPRLLQEYQVVMYHLPIKDGAAPDMDRLQVIMLHLVGHLLAGKNILVHCKEGLGRAGTICACVLIHCGIMAATAINTIRERRQGAIQTTTQEQFIHSYDQHIRTQ